MSLLLPQQYLKNWLTLFYFSSGNEVIFLFHILFDATVGESSVDFLGRRRFFLSCLSLLFFLNQLFMDVFRLFRASLWRLFASSDLLQVKKKMRQIIKICSEGVEVLLWVYFLFLSLSSVLSFFFVFLSFLSFSDNFNYNCYQLSIHHVPSNERAGLSTLELVKSGKSNFT